MVAEWKEKIKEKQEKLEKRPDLAVGSLEVGDQADRQRNQTQQKLLDDNEKQIATLMRRINTVPGVEVALGALDRDYQTKKAAYDSLLAATAEDCARCGCR